jgi:hypothetical protein
VPSAADIREVAFGGDHHRRGVERGRRLAATLSLPEPTGLPEGFVAACRRAACALYPPVLEEFEGLVEGGGFDRAKMEAHYFARLESRLGGCTMFGIMERLRAAGQGPVVGRNYDWAVADLHWCELQRYFPQEGLARIGYTHHWAGCPDVLNAAGLYVAIASLPAESVPAPGVQWNILVDMISETCASVGEAIEVCGRVRHLRPMSYLLADAAGETAVVEATPAEVRVRWPENGFVVATNVPLGGELVAASSTGNEDFRAGDTSTDRNPSLGPAAHRAREAGRLLSEKTPGISREGIVEILRDHVVPICTGDHEQSDGREWATIWSGICSPAEGDFRIAPGLPCRSEYRRFNLDRRARKRVPEGS